MNLQSESTVHGKIVLTFVVVVAVVWEETVVLGASEVATVDVPGV